MKYIKNIPQFGENKNATPKLGGPKKAKSGHDFVQIWAPSTRILKNTWVSCISYIFLIF